MSDIVIKADHLKKNFRNFRSNRQKLQYFLLGKKAGNKVRVLRDVSFEISRGEKVGIIGRPGSGRSTLMRLMAGIIQADSGTIEVHGDITIRFDNKLAFEMGLSGSDNYEGRCTLLGWSKEKMAENKQRIFEFAGLAKVMDDPIRTYKKGYANRLGFAIGTVDKPDIMLFDETMSFGDKRFTKRAVKRLRHLVAGDDITFVMAVSDVASARLLCKRGIIIDKGKVVFDGEFGEAIDYYKTNIKVEDKKSRDRSEAEDGEKPDIQDPEISAAEESSDEEDMDDTIL